MVEVSRAKKELAFKEKSFENFKKKSLITGGLSSRSKGANSETDLATRVIEQIEIQKKAL